MLDAEIEERTFSRWRSQLGYARGRNAFYTREEAEVVASFGRLVLLGVPYDEAHEVVYTKFGEKSNG